MIKPKYLKITVKPGTRPSCSATLSWKKSQLNPPETLSSITRLPNFSTIPKFYHQNLNKVAARKGIKNS